MQNQICQLTPKSQLPPTFPVEFGFVVIVLCCLTRWSWA